MKKIRIAQVKLHRAVVKPLALGIGEPRKMLSLRSLRDLSAFSEKIKHRVLKSSDSEWKKFSLEYLEEGEAPSKGDQTGTMVVSNSLALHVLFRLYGAAAGMRPQPPARPEPQRDGQRRGRRPPLRWPSPSLSAP